MEAEDLLLHLDRAPDLVADAVRGDGDLGHHGVRLPEQPHVAVVDGAVARQATLLRV